MMPNSSNLANDSPPIDQAVRGDRNQTIGQVLGGIVVYGQVIYNNPPVEPDSSTAKPKATEIGPNPYKGLLAFQETDGDRFFGRDPQIKELWEKFRSLHEGESAIRVLPIYGPSGSGKSSLARAGLIPELARRPLPGRDRARIAVLVPGDDPLYALAMVLARIATQDPSPVEKADEFKRVLSEQDKGEFSGLKRITYGLQESATIPLIVLVDQFEEIYSYEPKGDSSEAVKKRARFMAEREAFIQNLLYAASDRAQYVSLILTLRSDFLGATQTHPQLNQLIASQGFFVAAMGVEGLREAITKPAELAGHPLDAGTIDRLIEQTEGREGALPLLQFALTRIWAGLAEGREPAETLKAIGGVGGALAGEAQQIYKSLAPEDQKIARRVFLGLVQLGEGAKDTRRRTELERVVSHRDSLEQVQKVIARFSDPGARLITLAGDAGMKTAEVTHEALIDHWQQMKVWLDESRSDLRFQRRLDEAASVWKANGQPEGNLWRAPDLDSLESYAKRASDDMTTLQKDFFKYSLEAENTRQRDTKKAENEKRNQRRLLVATLFSSLLIIGASLAYYLINRIITQEAKGRVENYIFYSKEASALYNKLLEYATSEELSKRKIIALNKIKEWKIAKKQIDAPPYNGELLKKYLTDPYYSIKKYDRDWLIADNSYYTYQKVKIKEVLNFMASENTILVTLLTYQRRTYCKKIGWIIIPAPFPPQRTDDEEVIEIYKLIQTNNDWKIQDYRVLSKNWSKNNPQSNCSL